MNVSIPPELEAFVASKIAAGHYTSASEVVHEALRLLEERDQLGTAELDTFQHEINQRIASLDRGEFMDPEKTRDRLRQKSRELSKQSA